MTHIAQFTAGGVLQASDLNNFNQCTLLEGSFSVSNSASGGQNVTFTSEIIDVGGWHSNTTNTHLITPTVSGIYAIYGNGLNFNSSNRALINVMSNGSVIASQDNNDGAFDLSVSVLAPYTAGNNGFHLNVFQNSGATVTPTFRFAVHMLRAT